MFGRVAVLGIFAVDATYRATALPSPGQTVLGRRYAIGPGGKGSNQSVAAARAGAAVTFISKVGQDAFADIGRALWAEAGVEPHLSISADPTGSAGIFVDDATGQNAIVVCPGAAGSLGEADVKAAAAVIAAANVFVTQLEQPLAAARLGLGIARGAGVVTVLNPAPALPLDRDVLGLCDWVLPNESEAAALTGLRVSSADEAMAAARALRAMGAGGAVVTLGAAGAVLVTETEAVMLPAHVAGPVRDTTGAGDVFTGAFAAALAEGASPIGAARLATVAAGLSVTREGAAASAPGRGEIAAAMATQPEASR